MVGQGREVDNTVHGVIQRDNSICRHLIALNVTEWNVNWDNLKNIKIVKTMNIVQRNGESLRSEF